MQIQLQLLEHEINSTKTHYIKMALKLNFRALFNASRRETGMSNVAN